MLPLASFTGLPGLRLQPHTARLKLIQREAPSTRLDIAEIGATLSPGVGDHTLKIAIPAKSSRLSWQRMAKPLDVVRLNCGKTPQDEVYD